MTTTGLELARAFFEERGRPMLAEAFPDHVDRVACGLVGDGSECFGCDDALSRDHDWGPRFYLWLDDDAFAAIGAELQRRYDDLGGAFGGFVFEPTPEGRHRQGVWRIGDFYRQFTGLPGGPVELAEWRAVPERYLAAATNGEVFHDPSGAFTAVRERLLAFYPEDVRRKKIAHRAALMAQAGQYNFPRSARRGEWVAARCALDEFIRAGMSMIFLLNRVYAPFYKWMHRKLLTLPTLADTASGFAALASAPAAEPGLADRVEDICLRVAAELVRQGLSERNDSFLLDHCAGIMAGIADERLRRTHVMQE